MNKYWYIAREACEKDLSGGGDKSVCGGGDYKILGMEGERPPSPYIGQPCIKDKNIKNWT